MNVDQLQRSDVALPRQDEGTRHKGNIIVVDDQPANLKLMSDVLQREGYRVRLFPRGRLALAAASQEPPELFLLDINMPEMDGFEVCSVLKKDQRLAAIPVIFLSALNDTEDKVNAFRRGGADYITKPFRFEEVQARVETHVSRYRLQRESDRYAKHLEELVAARTRELADSQARLRVLDKAKSDFLNLISHELRTPLNGLFGISELLLDERPSASGDNFTELFEQARQRITAILDDALLLTQIDVEGERFTPRPILFPSVVDLAIRSAKDFANPRQVEISAEGMAAVFVLGHEALLTAALKGLLETAVKFSDDGKTVYVFSPGDQDAVLLTIQSSGHTIPDDAIPRFFDVFSINKAITVGGADLGLSPAVASRIVSLYGGSVSVRNRAGDGIEFEVCLQRSDRMTQ